MYIPSGDWSVVHPPQRHLGDGAVSSPEADRRFRRVAALITEGLETAKAAIPHLLTNAQRELLRFMASQLELFFPRGHGRIDTRGQVLRPSQTATVQVPVIGKDNVRWPPFEYRVRLFLSDQVVDPKLRGRHMTGHFSSIRLFTRTLDGTTPSRSVLTALHEMTHVMCAMVRSLERLRGADKAAQLLSREPWRLLDLSGFAGHRGRLERHVLDLLRFLPIPMQAGELAGSLVEEAFAYVFGAILDEAIARSSHAKKRTRGPAVLPTAGFSPEEFITSYVLEGGFSVTKRDLASRGAQLIFGRMTSDVDALAAALRTHLDG
jgi:hypothetical protein